ncbi:MAG: molybdopterin-dependent oxidoreductase, partial [Alphaproteobacteria bacterium]|nr:molybdopterin-dependent oxidoreductase [Alphaproteobacteria bacterium]
MRAPKTHPEIGVSRTHESAALHVTGRARYVDDMALPAGNVHIALGLSPVAHGVLNSIDATKALQAPGVRAVLTAADIPGQNDCSPVMGDDPIFAEKDIMYHGQSIFAVVADTRAEARDAVMLVSVDITPLPAVVTIDQAIEQDSFLEQPLCLSTGDPQAVYDAAPHKIDGELVVGGQEHFYLEGQAAIAMTNETGGIQLFVSSQHPSEIQHKVAGMLGLAYGDVQVDVRRMGGGFGGKESQSNLVACIAALAAYKTGRPARLVYDRDDDMRVTGKRHDAKLVYKAGFDKTGRISVLIIDQYLRCGMSYDLSKAIAIRAMTHAENAYSIANCRITARLCRTHTASNTAFRGFGGPQGMIGIERIIEEIAATLGRDPIEIRKVNYYPDYMTGHYAQTPYGQIVKDGILGQLTDALLASADYQRRRDDIDAYNKTNPVQRRGLGFTPVKFGISFNRKMLNQAGALVHVYTDGSVHLNHGGTEMGQGLHTKIVQIVADVFGIDVDNIRISATTTAKVPNTSATAASSGTDLNGMAALRAAETIKSRMATQLGSLYQAAADNIKFAAGKVHLPSGQALSFADAATLCHAGRVSLSATGFYATPDIHWDDASLTGSPYYYFAYGVALCEVV